ncbi:carboxypeptidase-like regulatory domain-containing protein [Pedobacter psychroterrae]|uniref:TonB-dependent receptor n=1 Tax=Pedobacter psychroterrae TaxID=2530453 RepID=A0A4V2MKH8_9SPHI|nr:carboxypeptidase-like regulatory domain-containing protein [Pedobacter psychroterrae]TCC98256.1 TonB-dependent receptor [Pedobacter psychroterrae]
MKLTQSLKSALKRSFKRASKRSVIALSLLFGVFILTLSFVPKNADPVEKIAAALQRWADTNPQEKVYLHTDKPYYIVGDTIWFKGYVTIGSKHQLSALSGALYVDLISETDSLTRSIKLPVISGMSKGNFVLPDSSFKEGNYRLRGYTQWMRNAGPEYYFDKVITIGNSIVDPVFAKIDYEYAKVGDKVSTLAVITYTNEKGEPLMNKPVNYDIREGYNSLHLDKKTTDASGQIKIPLQLGKSGKLGDINLVTKIETAPKDLTLKKFAVKLVSTQTDVQFFPESGSMVNGLRTRVAFKATGTNGLGVPVKGVVLDNENKEVAIFEALHLGMGSFRLLPEAGKSYQAKVTYPDGSENIVKLPSAIDNGYVLGVFNDAETDTVLVRINASEAALKNGAQQLSLVVQSGGAVFFATTMPVNKTAVSFSIPALDLPSGIVQFTLFSATGTPINERIIFIQNKDQMDLKLSTAKKVYAAREKVELDLQAADFEGKPIRGNFSVSVISEDAVPIDEAKESTILSHILLSSDIKGYIEQPNYYFTNPTPDTEANLDLLMMTQGYRRFVWKDLIGEIPFHPKFKPEKLTMDITGTLVNLANKPVPIAGGNILLLTNKLDALPMDTVTDANGRFKFSNLLVTSEIKFSVQGRRGKSDKVEVKMDKIREEDVSPNPNIPDLSSDMRMVMQASFENSRRQDQELTKNGQLGRTQQLKEVVIRAEKRKRVYTGLNILDGHADLTLRNDKTDNYLNLLDWLKFKLVGVIFKETSDAECYQIMMPFSRNEKMVVFVDGRKLTPCETQDLWHIDPLDVERVDMIRSNLALMSMAGGPAISIITKRGIGQLRTTYNPSLAFFNPRGFDSAKEFYAPKYNNNGNDPRVPDLRTTIYWNPGVAVAQDGKVKLNFFNGDSKGKYRVVVEGINADGLLGRQVYRYEVK